MSTQISHSLPATLLFCSRITGPIKETVGSALDESNLGLLDGARLGIVNALTLPRRDKGYHPGCGNDTCLLEKTAGLVKYNNAAVVADAELCAEHVRKMDGLV